MARKKDPPKPLFGLKHDFYDSLDNFIQYSINLHQMARSLLDLNVVPDKLKPMLQEKVDALETAMMSKDD